MIEPGLLNVVKKEVNYNGKFYNRNEELKKYKAKIIFMERLLKDLFATYRGLVPKEQKTTNVPIFNRWNMVSGLMDQLSHEEDDDVDEDTSIMITPEGSYSPTLQENASYLDFIHTMQQRLDKTLMPRIDVEGNTENSSENVSMSHSDVEENNSEDVQFLNNSDSNKSLSVTNTDLLPSSVLDSIRNNQSGYEEFLKHLRIYSQQHNIYPEDKDMLIGIAALESNFNSRISNGASSASGWFQFVDNTRKSYSNVTKEQFLNNSQLQIDAAYKHLQDVKEQAKTFMDRYGTSRGLTPFQIVRGMWFRPESMRSYLQNGKDISNGGKEYVDSQGTTLEKVLNSAK